MVVQCPKCEKKYKIDSSKVTSKGAKITCSFCGHVFIVRKKAKAQKKDFVPCIYCGEPATIDLDTDKPICKRCKTLEEKTARFQPMNADKNAGSMQEEFAAGMARILYLEDDDVSVDDFFDKVFYRETYSAFLLSDQGKKHLPPEKKPAPSPEPQPPKPTPPDKPSKSSDVPLIITAKTRKPKMKRHSLLVLADRANDGFLSIARLAGKAVYFVQSVTMGGLSKIGHALFKEKKNKKSKHPSRTEVFPTD